MKNKPVSTTKPEWWHEGVQFQCQGSGKCCTSRGEYGFVFISLKDRRLMAKFLGLSTSSFTKKYCTKLSGAYHLNEDGKNPDCLFLKNNQCSVYQARPTQCRTWPFWPEVMNAKAWARDVLKFCPGVGKGRKYTKDEIQESLRIQTQTEAEILARS